eukprot:gene18476-20326_t
MLEYHTSVLGFINSMKWRNGLSSSQAESLYRLLVNESFEEFRNLAYKLETCLAVAPHTDDFSACMQCPKAAPASSFGKENLLRILSDKVVISFAVADNSVSSINLSDPAEKARVLAASEANEEQMEEESSISIDASGGMELESGETERSILSSVEVEGTEVKGEVEGTTYIVEKLLNSKLIKKKRHYLVKWRGFVDPTWEPHNNIPLHMRRDFNKEKKQ